MGETLPLFTTSFNRGLAIESRAEHLTGDAGAIVQRELLERSGIIPWLVARLEDPRRAECVTYPLAELLRTVLMLLGQGWRDQDDADALRHDPALRLASASGPGPSALGDGRHLPSQPTLSRLLDVLSSAGNRRILREAVLELSGRRTRAERRGRRHRRITLDVDSLPIEVHGAQPGSAWNGHYHQRMYHPIVAGIAETGDLLDARLRAGNAHTAEGALEFILDLVDRAEETLCQVAMVRMDAGFPSEGLLSGLEARGTPYVARLSTNKALDRMAAPHLKRPPGRPPAEGRVWFHEMTYRAGSWSRERRVVLVVLERPEQLLLDHFWLITSVAETAMPAADLLAHYRRRGSVENAFGELMDVLEPALSSAARAKTHYRGRKLPSLPSETDAFARNDALLLLNLLAYGVLHAGRRRMEAATRTGWSLRRFRERVLKAGGRILLHARRATLVLADSAARFWRLLWPEVNRLRWQPP